MYAFIREINCNAFIKNLNLEKPDSGKLTWKGASKTNEPKSENGVAKTEKTGSGNDENHRSFLNFKYLS